MSCNLVCAVCQVLNHCFPTVQAPPLSWSIDEAVPSPLCAVAIETDIQVCSLTLGRKNLSQPKAVLLCNTVISTASSMPCSSALCSSIFLPLGLVRGSCLCNRLYVPFSKTARKQLWDAAEGEPNAQCFECLTKRDWKLWWQSKQLNWCSYSASTDTSPIKIFLLLHHRYYLRTMSGSTSEDRTLNVKTFCPG